MGFKLTELMSTPEHSERCAAFVHQVELLAKLRKTCEFEIENELEGWLAPFDYSSLPPSLQRRIEKKPDGKRHYIDWFHSRADEADIASAQESIALVSLIAVGPNKTDILMVHVAVHEVMDLARQYNGNPTLLPQPEELADSPWGIIYDSDGMKKEIEFKPDDEEPEQPFSLTLRVHFR